MMWIIPGAEAIGLPNIGMIQGDVLYLGHAQEPDLPRLKAQIERADFPGDVLGDKMWSLKLTESTNLEVIPDMHEMEIHMRRGGVRIVAFPDKQTAIEVFEAVRAVLGQGWNSQTRFEAYRGRGLIYLGVAIVLMGITGLSYWGVASGWVTRGPAWLAGLVNLVGPVGILVVGGIFSLIAAGAGVRRLLVKNEVWSLARQG